MNSKDTGTARSGRPSENHPKDGDHYPQYGMRGSAQDTPTEDQRRFGEAGYGGYEGEYGEDRSFGSEGVDYDEEYRVREARNARPRSLPTGAAPDGADVAPIHPNTVPAVGSRTVDADPSSVPPEKARK